MAKNRPRRGSPLRLTPSFELFGQSRDIVLKNVWIFGPLAILPVVFMFHTWLWTPAGPGEDPSHWDTVNWFSAGWFSVTFPTYIDAAFVGFSLMWLLLVLVGGFIVQIMNQAAQLEGSEGKTVGFGSIWKTTKELGLRMIGLYVLVGLVILGGFILLIIPGLIFLRRYFLSPYVLLDKKVGIREAMKRSADISKPHSGSVWGVIGLMFLIGLIGILPWIGWLIAFVLGLFYSVAPALRYQELKKLS